MGYRSDKITDDDEAADDEALRKALARYQEPAFIPTPPDLAMRVQARLHQEIPSASTIRERRVAPGPMLAWGALALLALIALFGGWGVLFDSSGPASALGELTGGPGRFVLVLTLIAKPLVHTLLAPGWAGFVIFVLGLAILIWGWRQLLRSITLPYSIGAGT